MQLERPVQSTAAPHCPKQYSILYSFVGTGPLDATPENTTLVDGSPVNTKDGEGARKWLPDEGNRCIFETERSYELLFVKF